MKLFSREGTDKEQDDFDDLDLPTKDDLNEDFISNEAQAPSPAKARPASPRYDIEDAIKLMRTLPKDSSDLVVTVVNKTLQSLEIEVTDIIQSAEDKEQGIRDRNAALEQEVKELEAKIADKNSEMEALMEDYRETAEVKKRLKLAVDIEAKMNRGNTKPEAPTPPAAENDAVEDDSTRDAS